jgi:rod shape-determining protein MreC
MPVRRLLALLTLLCVGHVLLISVQVQSSSGMPVAESVAFGAFARVQWATGSVGDTLGGIWSHYFALSGAARENELLRRRILELEFQMQEQQALIARTRALEEALGLQQTLGFPTIVGRVIAGSALPGSNSITIDRGWADGVRPDMAVIARHGVVGRVIGQPAEHAALVQLIISSHAALGARLEASGAGGVVSGQPAEKKCPLLLEYVPNLIDVKPGEKVVTSGQDGIYPPGFVIGTVIDAQPGPPGQPYQLINVRPSVDFSYVDVVVIVMTQPPALTGGRP